MYLIRMKQIIAANKMVRPPTVPPTTGPFTGLRLAIGIAVDEALVVNEAEERVVNKDEERVVNKDVALDIAGMHCISGRLEVL
jgi:hypothetical protein